jgi:translation initiation factor IF-3
MELTGKMVKVFPKNQVSEKFVKREFVIETNDTYPQKILVQMTQDRCDLLDGIGEGENVKVMINLRGREWTNPEGVVKYFNSIEGWKIENQSTENFKPNMGNFDSDVKKELQEDDGLPF